MPVVTIFTARNEVGARLCFSRVCDSVHRGVSGLHPGGKLRGLAGGSPGPHPGGRLRGLTERGWVVSRPTPGRVSRPTQGGLCLIACWDTLHPTPRRLLQWAVCIPLECIVVENKFLPYLRAIKLLLSI